MYYVSVEWQRQRKWQRQLRFGRFGFVQLVVQIEPHSDKRECCQMLVDTAVCDPGVF